MLYFAYKSQWLHVGNKNIDKRVERNKGKQKRKGKQEKRKKKEDQTSCLSFMYKMESLFLLTAFFSGRPVQRGSISWYQE